VTADGVRGGMSDPKKAPQPLPNPDFTKLKEYLAQSVATFQDGGRVKDFEYYVHERAIEAVYGPGFWKWYNLEDRNT
jgi:hypothetical protein